MIAPVARPAEPEVVDRTVALPYCASPYHYARRRTHPVMVGKVGVGGDNPIRVQSMTTTKTLDTEETVAQTIRLVEAGCEIVRITAPTVKAARNLGVIRDQLAARGVHVPLVADIHFSPDAALEAAEHVDKVRVNPGNYADSRQFAVREYTDAQYAAELARIETRFAPLVLKCRARGIAMRVGTNHGSLSDRIVNRFGDTPEGMVESALEFVRICGKYDYHAVILSMKASNPKVMIAAYRLLAARMAECGMTYPFHLGVTEAGNGEDARIKSAIGIGSLLADGIGDTIRVSLAEDPEAEIPVAFALARRYPPRSDVQQAPATIPEPTPNWDPYHFERRASRPAPIGPLTIGAGNLLAVVARLEGPTGERVAQLLRWASPGARRLQRPDIVEWPVTNEGDVAALEHAQRRLASARGLALLGDGGATLPKLAILAASGDAALLQEAIAAADGVLLQNPTPSTAARLAQTAQQAGKRLWLEAAVEPAAGESDGGVVDRAVEQVMAALGAARGADDAPTLSLSAAAAETLIRAQRLLTARLAEANCQATLFLRSATDREPLIGASLSLGSLLCDGIGDAVQAATPSGGQEDVRFTLNVLQAAGARLTKTDYVACPSCGRTLFDLQTTTDRIKAKTAHLAGVRIAIMGCVVNGPGEMADADFGYVGGSPNHVNLYVGRTCVERNVPAERADEQLIALIKAHGRWQEPATDEPDT